LEKYFGLFKFIKYYLIKLLNYFKFSYFRNFNFSHFLFKLRFYIFLIFYRTFVKFSDISNIEKEYPDLLKYKFKDGLNINNLLYLKVVNPDVEIKPPLFYLKDLRTVKHKKLKGNQDKIKDEHPLNV